MNVNRPVSKQPIPIDANFVFKGKLFDVYQWEQQLFNGKKVTFEKLKRPDTVNVIPITTNGEIIISEQEQPGVQPFIGCLGGKIDEGEEPLAAAKRELLEETGMEAMEYVLWDSIQLVDKIDWVIYTFIAKGAHRVQDQSLEAGERIRLRTVTLDQFIKLSAQDNFRDAEVALKIFKTFQNSNGLKEIKEIFRT